MKQTFYDIKSFVDNDLPLRINYVGESFCDETFYFKRSDYNAYSLEYIVDGEGTLNINGRTLIPKKDDIFFLAKHSYHDYYSQKENPWHKIYVSFDGFIADRLVEKYLPQDTYVFENTKLKNVFLNINRIASATGDDMRKKHDLIAAELFKVFLSVKSISNSRPLDLAHKIKKTLDMNLQKPYTVAQLSKEFNYTDNHLINVFQKQFGETPYQYYSKRKLSLAKEYLETTQLTVSEISEMLCYADPQYFSTCFKKLTGTTPSKYRKNLNR